MVLGVKRGLKEGTGRVQGGSSKNSGRVKRGYREGKKRVPVCAPPIGAPIGRKRVERGSERVAKRVKEGAGRVQGGKKEGMSPKVTLKGDPPFTLPYPLSTLFLPSLYPLFTSFYHLYPLSMYTEGVLRGGTWRGYLDGVLSRGT